MTQRFRRTLIVLAVASLGGAAVLAFASSPAGSTGRCKLVEGRILDEHAEGSVGVARIVGSIKGRYEFTFTGLFPDPTQPTVGFSTGEVRIITNKGNLFWHESSATDLVNEDEFSTATLATLKGGTGEWEGVTGHVDLSGFFHTSTFTGEFDYRGVICRGD